MTAARAHGARSIEPIRIRVVPDTVTLDGLSEFVTSANASLPVEATDLLHTRFLEGRPKLVRLELPLTASADVAAVRYHPTKALLRHMSALARKHDLNVVIGTHGWPILSARAETVADLASEGEPP